MEEGAKPAPLAGSLVAQITAKRQMHVTVTTDSHFMVRFGDVTLISQLISGSAPDVKKLLDTFEEPTKIRVFASEMHNAVQRVSAIAQETKAAIVRMEWTETEMSVSAHSEESGDVEAKFKIFPGATPGKIAIACPYLLEYFKGKDGIVLMGTKDPSAPLVLRYRRQSHGRYHADEGS